MSGTPASPVLPATGNAIQVYLLGTVPFEDLLALQRRLVYQVASDRTRPVLLLCEHPPVVTVGRHGSRGHILCEPDELHSRRWRVRWVNRGGGCILHLPGQLAVYPILPLDRLGLGIRAFLDRLHAAVAALLADFGVRSEMRTRQAGVWVGPRPVAVSGLAVRDWVTYFGTYLNVSPDLEGYRRVRSGGAGAEPMTSLERERHGAVRPALVRERFLEHFAAHFRLTATSLFFDYPALTRRAPADAVARSL